MDNRVLALKAAAGLVALVVAALVPIGPVRRLPFDRARALAFGLLAGSRLLVFTALYIVLRVPPHSDVPAVYYPQALRALAGGITYRDFPSSYAPLFPYVASLPLHIARNPASLIVPAILFELAAFPLWTAAARRALPAETVNLAMLFYLLSPLALLDVAVDGFNQIWIAFFLAAAVYLALRSRWLAAGLTFGLSICVVKFLPIIAAPAYLGGRRPSARFALGAAAIIALVYGAFVLLGANVLYPLHAEGADSTSGNLPYLLTAVGLQVAARSGPVATLTAAVTAVCVLAAVALLWTRYRAAGTGIFAIAALPILLLVLMLVSRKAYTDYLAMVLFPLCLIAACDRSPRRSMLLFTFFGGIAAIEPTLWFRWLNEGPLFGLSGAVTAPAHHARLLIFFAVDCVLIALYVYYLAASWRFLAARVDAEPATRSGRPAAEPVQTVSDGAGG